jgi:hypothetical protein
MLTGGMIVSDNMGLPSQITPPTDEVTHLSHLHPSLLIFQLLYRNLVFTINVALMQAYQTDSSHMTVSLFIFDFNYVFVALVSFCWPLPSSFAKSPLPPLACPPLYPVS